jgi:hypothetical protein
MINKGADGQIIPLWTLTPPTTTPINGQEGPHRATTNPRQNTMEPDRGKNAGRTLQDQPSHIDTPGPGRLKHKFKEDEVSHEREGSSSLKFR